MFSIILPSRPRRALLISFWLAVSASAGLLTGLVASLLISPISFGWGLILGLVLAGPGLLSPQHIVANQYKIFHKMANYYVRGARLLLLAVCFCITWAVGRIGSSLNLVRPVRDTSLWVPRGMLPPSTYGIQSIAGQADAPEKCWIRNYLSWAFHSGNLWAAFLLPYLVLLKMLENEHEIAYPSNIYTLF